MTPRSTGSLHGGRYHRRSLPSSPLPSLPTSSDPQEVIYFRSRKMVAYLLQGGTIDGPVSNSFLLRAYAFFQSFVDVCVCVLVILFFIHTRIVWWESQCFHRSFIAAMGHSGKRRGTTQLGGRQQQGRARLFPFKRFTMRYDDSSSSLMYSCVDIRCESEVVAVGRAKVVMRHWDACRPGHA